jgi:hypothetical protein
MLPTGDISDSDEEEDYSEQNVQATYPKAFLARIQPIIQQQTVEMEIEPKPIRVRAGQAITRTHERLLGSMRDDEHISMPDLVSDDEDQESIHGTSNFEVQDDGIIELQFEYMHFITHMAFPDEVIRVNKQTRQIVPLRKT